MFLTDVAAAILTSPSLAPGTYAVAVTVGMYVGTDGINYGCQADLELVAGTATVTSGQAGASVIQAQTIATAPAQPFVTTSFSTVVVVSVAGTIKVTGFDASGYATLAYVEKTTVNRGGGQPCTQMTIWQIA